MKDLDQWLSEAQTLVDKATNGYVKNKDLERLREGVREGEV